MHNLKSNFTFFNFKRKFKTREFFLVLIFGMNALGGVGSVATAATLPDFVFTSSITPRTATTGSLQTFNATLANQGGTDVTTNYMSFFECATSSSGANAVVVSQSGSTVLAAGGSTTKTGYITFPKDGTYYVRFGADKSGPTDSGQHTESNENNNITAWTSITVGAGGAVTSCYPQNPTAPTITGSAACATGSANAYTFQGTDPAGGTIRYQIDWDNNGTVDQTVPSSGYVSSGTSQSTSRTWSTDGSYTFKVRTQNNGGSVSGWTSKTVTCSTANTAPNAPTITGSATGAPNTSYSFSFRATDPNSDTIRYGIDWDNNSVVDAWLPTSGYVASNTLRSANYSWTTSGAKTFKARTQDSKGANSAWSTPFTITLSNPPTPTLNYTINGSASSLSVSLNENLNIVWSTTNVTSCTAYGAGWSSGTSVGTSGNITIPATQTDDYIMNCVGTNGALARSITVNLANILKVCQNSCSSGIPRGNTSVVQDFTMAQGGTQNLVSCFNPSSSCNDASGNVNTVSTWNEDTSSNVVTLSGSDPKAVTANSSGTENISASYSSQTANMRVTVTCLPTVSCSNAPGKDNYCKNETFTVDNGCGTTITCNGTKTCNYNWKEVAP